MNKKDVLSQSDFGQRVAEEEADALIDYFVETENWQKVYNGDTDIVYGPKGAGKSAIYSLLVYKTDELFDRGRLLVAGENPRGAPAFQNLSVDPPESEEVFVGLWKLYIVALINRALLEYGIGGEEAANLNNLLAEQGLATKTSQLSAIVQTVLDYVRSFFRREVEAVEGGLSFDTVTQLPNGISGKITFREPGGDQKRHGFTSIATLYELANTALSKAGYSVWILLDRLDVAFAENSDLEKNALRALFRAYLDLNNFEQVKLKVFLRTDIWRRIIEEGFREASHITRHVTISWNDVSALNLVVRRFLKNEAIVEAFAVDRTSTLGNAEDQTALFYRICPEQVEVGPNKTNTFNWMLSHTADATQQYSPREIIHFMNSLRVEQLRRLENGLPPPDGERLFDRVTFKDAMPEVSTVRLQQTLYAEYPQLKPYIEKLREQKTSQSVSSLAFLWNVDEETALKTAEALVSAGFFQIRGDGGDRRFWVPFLYRDALKLSQGSAE